MTEMCIAICMQPTPPSPRANELSRLLGALLDKNPSTRPTARQARNLLSYAGFPGTPNTDMPWPEGSTRQFTTTSVVLPALGESVTEGSVTRWLKRVGERVQKDEPLLEVSTDKVDTELPAPATGVLLSIDVPEGHTVLIGAQLALIETRSNDSGH